MPLTSVFEKQNRAPESRGGLQKKFIAGVVYDLIAQRGIENVTMRQVAEAAQISLGTITYHFRTKQNMVAAALESGYELPEDWDQYMGSPVEQLRHIALSYAFDSPNSRWWRFWINHVAMSTRDTELQASQSQRFDKQRRFWIKLLLAGKGQGEISPAAPIEQIVDQMLIEVHGLVILQMVKPTDTMRAEARDRINAMIDGILITPGWSAP